MRSDYALYAVAIIFFLITGISFALQLAEFERNVWVVTTAILGLFFIGLGYTQRPKPQAAQTPPTPAAPATPAPAPTPTPAPAETKVTEVIEVSKPKIELTEVKGIGAKRAEQLKSLGISSVEDLAKASAKELATKLKISPKITGKWIEDAKRLIEKS